MKNQKFILDIDDDDEIIIGLVRLVKELPDHELFFHINQLNPFQFRRITDLIVPGQYYTFHYPRYQAFLQQNQTCVQLISNRASQQITLQEAPVLFTGEEEKKHLLPRFEEVDFLITTSEPIDDFSVILLPDHLAFQIQEYPLSAEDELYHLIEYYE